MDVLRYGAVYARTLPATRAGSLWAHIAIVNYPGAPFLIDPHCSPSRVYYVNA